MQASDIRKLGNKLEKFIEEMTCDMGRPERRRAMGLYVTGLLLDGDRKSIAPIAARLVEDLSEAEAMRQRLHECISVSAWDDDEIRRRLARHVEAANPGLEAFVIDDTGFPKKGKKSVGVARQYSGTLGRVDNCQVATSLHLAGPTMSVCIAMHLYLPKEWADDAKRRKSAGIPEDIGFRPKWQIALDQIDDALRWGLQRRLVLADAGYGEITEFRHELEARELSYVVGIPESIKIWRPGEGPEPPPPPVPGKGGRTRNRWRTTEYQPVTVKGLALERGRKGLSSVRWRQGSKGLMTSRFGFVRVRTAHEHTRGRPPGPEQWLLYEWPTDEATPTKYWLTTLPAGMTKRALIRLAKLRWRVERDYQDMKGEVGLDHFEGRGWRGFHHHVTLCALAHAFLALRRALFSPQDQKAGQPILSDLARSTTPPPSCPDSHPRALPHVRASCDTTVAPSCRIADLIK